MRSVEEALAGILAAARVTEAENVPLEACFGRAPASFQLTAAVDVPAFDNSSMDGYAVRAADTPGSLRLIGEVAAGAGTLPDVVPGTTVRIMTGAPMPPGADAVAPIEVVEERGVAGGGAGTAPGAYVRRAGHDTRRGETVTLPRRCSAPPARACWPRWVSAGWRCVVGRASRSCRPATSCATWGPFGTWPDPRCERHRPGGGHHGSRRRAAAAGAHPG